MELDITDFFNECAPMEYSASVAEIGQNAGRDTWAAALDDATDYNILDTEEKKAAVRDFLRGFGAWDDNEIADWDDNELTALLIQFIAGDIREAGLDTNAPDWTDHAAQAEAGDVPGRLFLGTDNRVYYYVGE